MKKLSDTGQAIWTVAGIIKWTTGYFEEYNIDSPRMTAEYLLAHALELSRIDLYLQYDKPLGREELGIYKGYVKRRINREPLAYITGSKGFWSLDLAVSPDVLIPRPDTECLVGEALKLIDEKYGQNPLTVADLGTGSGAIIISLAVSRPGHRYIGVDISEKAISIATENARANCPDSGLTFLAGNWLAPFRGEEIFDLIVSNPPYIPSGDIAELQREITDYEPLLALDGDRDGLKCIRHIIRHSEKFLKPGGHLLIETGFDQSEAVVREAEETGFYTCIRYIRDLAGHNRVVSMKKEINA